MAHAGQFQPGQSGNPGGRVGVDPKVREAARAHTEAAIAVLAAALQDDQTKNRILAANSLLDRAWGKPAQSVVGPDGDGPVQVLYGWLTTTRPEPAPEASS